MTTCTHTVQLLIDGEEHMYWQTESLHQAIDVYHQLIKEWEGGEDVITIRILDVDHHIHGIERCIEGIELHGDKKIVYE